MRRILIERARKKQAQKRGKSLKRVELDEAELSLETSHEDLLSLDEALTKLERIDPPKAGLV